MKNFKGLVANYKNAINENTKEHFHHLAVKGQSPKIMVIGCCDSRVDPDYLFQAKPGEIFVSRNVANLVPPYEPDDSYRGTSTAIEFAVQGLKVEHIVIMGHSLCGGIRACCEGVKGEKVEGVFLPIWTSMLKDEAEKILKENEDTDIEVLAEKVEKQGIRFSLKNLKTFPFIAEAIAEERLQIHGAYFDIKTTQLYVLDQETDEFLVVE